MLHSFSVENYRSFATTQEIELKPLTLFFGWNSGGKSALVRFLPLLAESIKLDGPPIWLGGDVGRRATWGDFVCKATGRSRVQFGLRFNDPPELSADWTVEGDPDGRFQEVFDLRFLQTPHFQVRHDSHIAGGNAAGKLLPPPAVDTQIPAFAKLRESLHALAGDVQWISGVRKRPPRVASCSSGTTNLPLKPDGSNAIDLLVAHQSSSTADPVIESTQTFFTALGSRLVVDDVASGVWRLLLQPARPHAGVNICDVGEGYAQVLPILVAMAKARVDGPRILCLEQPELHLHTRAQVELARQLVATALSPRRPTLLIETHSEVLLMSLQLAIARGEVPKEIVRVYWVEAGDDGCSTAVPVDFNDSGQPASSALTQAFTEAIRLGQELAGIQLRNVGI